MTTKYIIRILRDTDPLVDMTFGSKVYIYRYRSNYEYAELCFKKSEAKTYCTFKAAETAAQILTSKYTFYKGYEIIKTSKK